MLIGQPGERLNVSYLIQVELFQVLAASNRYVQVDIFDPEIVAKFELLGQALLRESASLRDQRGAFDMAAWEELRKARLFDLAAEEDTTRRHQIVSSALYGLAKGSLDLPFCASVAAHVAIGTDLLITFGNEWQKARYLPEVLAGNSIMAMCNAEIGSGTDLRKMRSQFQDAGQEVVLTAEKPCSTNLSIAGLALVSAASAEGEIRVFLLEGQEFQQAPLQDALFSFRTGAVGSMKAENITLVSAEREVAHGLAALRHCLHTERFYLGVLVSGLMDGLEKLVHEKVMGKPVVHEKQYLQEKLVQVRQLRVQLDALMRLCFAKSQGGARWEGAAGELSVVKLLLNLDAAAAARSAYEAVGCEAVLLSTHFQRAMRDLTALAYFGGTSELQKMQIFQDLVPRATKKSKRAA